MFTKKSFWPILVVLFSLLLLSGTATARSSKALGDTSFTYQGRLTASDSPANGNYDFIFTLYDASSEGNQVGSDTVEDVPVTGGLFTVQLDFGTAFDGSKNYLEISVRPTGSGEDYTVLDPRQPITPAPYAIYAGSAQNVVVVAKSNGDFTSIQAALDSITDASESNPYLVYVAPGVYDERVTMKEYVDIEGSGELATKITAAGFYSGANDATVKGADNAELRFLTVESIGSSITTAIRNDGVSPRLTHVTANALEAGGNFGVFNDSASPTMTDVTINVSGDGNANEGVNNDASSPTMNNVTISVSGASNQNHGVNNDFSSAPEMTNVTISVSGAATYNYGVYNYDSSATMKNVNIGASGGTDNYGIYNRDNGNSRTVLIDNSQISGSTNTIYMNSYYTVRIGASQLSGGAIRETGIYTCIGVYDENYENNNGYTECP
ncbi:MAG: hypothetical protein ACOCYU_03260 [Brevefilum sp.]